MVRLAQLRCLAVRSGRPGALVEALQFSPRLTVVEANHDLAWHEATLQLHSNGSPLTPREGTLGLNWAGLDLHRLDWLRTPSTSTSTSSRAALSLALLASHASSLSYHALSKTSSRAPRHAASPRILTFSADQP